MKKKKSPTMKAQADSFGTFLEIAQNISPERRRKNAISRGGEETLPLSDIWPQEDTLSRSAEQEEAGEAVLRLVAEHEPLSVADLMKRCRLDFWEFARQMNQLAEHGLLEITSSEEDPAVEMVHLSLRGRQIAEALLQDI